MKNAWLLAVALLTCAAQSAHADDSPNLLAVATAPTSQPVKCYALVDAVSSNVTVGLAVDLCADSRDAVTTVACFVQAGNLGLNMGQAVRLCAAKTRETP